MNGAAEGWRDVVVTEFFGLNNLTMSQRTLRFGHLKYGFNSGCKDELYDLSRDPHETLNLIDHPDYANSTKELRSRLVEWMRETQDPMSWWYRRMNSYYR
jgi:hypothetical protein